MARHGGERPTATSSWQLSPPESRIPRPSSSPSPSPSPTALRRSASLRGSRTRNCVEHRTQQLHHNQDHLFPVITENGTVTPKRCYSSLSLTPSRGRARASPGSGQPSCGEDCSDAESVKSFGSGYSTASACDHASFALNGTTWSGRSRRYVVHCSSRASDNDEYLTPTQRAQRQIRKFQSLLKEARKEIEDKDREIFRLTKELVELRLYKASLNSPDEKTDSSEAATVRENNPFSPESPCRELSEDAAVASDSPDAGQATTAVAAAATVPVAPHPAPPPPPPPPPPPGSSLVDSGHFEDGSVHSKESVPAPASPAALRYVDESPLRDEERKRIVDHYEGRIEEMHRRHVDEIQSLKESHNDKVESLLNQLSDISTRYCETRPSLDKAEARAREAETQLETLRNQLAEQTALLADQEERNKQMYLKMYSKGQEAARIEQADQIVEQAQKNPSKVSVGELLQQLTVTQAELENVKPFQDSSYSVPEPLILANRSQRLLSVEEAVSLWVLGTRKVMYRRILESRNNQGALDPEITLQFLKSAIYYFLTDKENLHGHLNAIESILGFTESEKLNIDRIYRSARK